MAATIERFGPTSDPDAVHAGLERDGAVIVEGLLSSDGLPEGSRTGCDKPRF